MRSRVLVAIAIVLGFAVLMRSQSAPAQQPSAKPLPAELSPAAASVIQKRVESFLRNAYGWGPSFELQVGPVASSPVNGLYEVPVTVKQQGESDTAVVYVSGDGRYMF